MMSRPDQKVVILGGNGVLARELGPVLARRGWTVAAVPRAACDIGDEASVRACFERERPALVVNCAAYTQVDKAESEPAQAFAINGTAAGTVARAAADAGAKLVHISSDYVFDGKKRTPYVETDPTGPLGVYARSKLAGEEAVLAAGGQSYVVRTGELYGHGGRNFFHVILARARNKQPLKVIDDQVVSPTWTRELSEQLAVLVDKAPPGVYHATNDGATTWYEAAKAAIAFAGLEADVKPCTTAEFGSPTPRPAYSVLGHDALVKLGIYQMRPWRETLGAWLSSPDV